MMALKNFYIFLLLLGCFSAYAYPQTEQEILAFKKDLKQTTNDSIRIDILKDLAWQYTKVDQDSAIKYALLTIQSDLPKTPYQLSVAYNVLGKCLQKRSDYDSAFHFFDQSLRLRKLSNDTLPLVNAYLNLGSLLSDIGEYARSIDTLKVAIQLLDPYPEKGDNFKVKAKLLNILGNNYMESGNLKEAFTTLSKAYQLRLQSGNKLEIAKSALNFGHLYELIYNATTAEELYNLALNNFKAEEYKLGIAKSMKSLADLYLLQKKFKQAEENYQRAVIIFKEEDDKQELAGTYSNLGHLREIMGNYDEAIKYQSKSLGLYSNIPDLDGLALTYNQLGQVYLERNDYTKALVNLHQAERLADSLGIPLILIEVYNGLADAYGQKKNFEKAHIYKVLAEKKYLEQDQEIRQLIHERQIAEKDAQILEEKLAIEKHINEKQNLEIAILYIVGTALLLLFFALFINYRQQLKLKRAKEAERNRSREINQIMQDQKVHNMDALIEGQQIERVRIAQDIHDRLGSLLSVLKIHFAEVSDTLKSIKSKTEKKVNKVNDLIDEAAIAIREISKNLRSGLLDKMGLVPAIEHLCTRVRETGKIEVELHTDSLKKQKLNTLIEWIIFRNTEEALANILTHAHATRVIVQIFRGKDHISVTIEDNGKGFDPDGVEESKSTRMGLEGMKARVRKYNGSFEIDSKINRGTIIMMDFKTATLEED